MSLERPIVFDPLGDGISKLEFVSASDLVNKEKYTIDQMPLLAARISSLREGKTGEDPEKDKHLARDTLAQNKHMTPFEHIYVTFRVIAPIFVFREWHRHRTQCIIGDSLITFERPCDGRSYKMTMNDVWRKWQKTIRKKRPQRQTEENSLFSRNRLKNMKLRVLDTQTMKFTSSQIKEVFFNGEKPCFKLTLSNGKTLTLTKEHHLLTSNGWQTLEQAIGLEMKKNIATISKECWIFTNGKQVPWNKGKFGYKINHIMTEEHKQTIRKARSGHNSNFWKGGVSSERANIARWTTEQAPKVHEKFNYTCQMCGGRGGQLDAHHIKSVVEFPELAFEFENLQSVHRVCHKTFHRQQGHYSLATGNKGLIPKLVKIISVEYVGFKQVYDIEVEHEAHNYIANGIIVHNSYNEMSARYLKEYPKRFYIPKKWRMQSTSNKQGSSEEVLSEDYVSRLNFWMKIQYENCFELYKLSKDNGIANELARIILPVGLYSEMYATASLRNWYAFYELRSDNAAQWEIRQYAYKIGEILGAWFPETWGALSFWKTIGLSNEEIDVILNGKELPITLRAKLMNVRSRP